MSSCYLPVQARNSKEMNATIDVTISRVSAGILSKSALSWGEV